MRRVAGFIGAIWDPAWFIAEQLPDKQVLPASEHSIVMAQQLGNMYLLMCFVGLAVLATSSEIKVVRSYLVALWLGDIGHLAFTCLALGKERVMQPHMWNAMTWGNIGFTGGKGRRSVEGEEQQDGIDVKSGNWSGLRR
ncbi:hypothetical protein CRV24_004595 [Beauveria bassiana]|nr:hypothetical protein CRV24_004595 [Beauveria bassiana]